MAPGFQNSERGDERGPNVPCEERGSVPNPASGRWIEDANLESFEHTGIYVSEEHHNVQVSRNEGKRKKQIGWMWCS